MAIIAGKAELILICLVTVAPQEFAPHSLGLLPFLWSPKSSWEFLVVVQVKFHSGRVVCAAVNYAGGPNNGNSSNKSACGPTLSVTFRFA